MRDKKEESGGRGCGMVPVVIYRNSVSLGCEGYDQE